MKFDYIYTRINVKNCGKCKNFYSNILGFEADFEKEKSVEFKTGSTKISLQKRNELVFDPSKLNSQMLKREISNTKKATEGENNK